METISHCKAMISIISSTLKIFFVVDKCETDFKEKFICSNIYFCIENNKTVLMN